MTDHTETTWREWVRPPRGYLLAASMLAVLVVMHSADQNWFFAAVNGGCMALLLWAAYRSRDKR